MLQSIKYDMDKKQLMNQITIVKDKFKMIKPMKYNSRKTKRKIEKIRSGLHCLQNWLRYYINFIPKYTFLITHKCWYNSDENLYIQTSNGIIIMGSQYPLY